MRYASPRRTRAPTPAALAQACGRLRLTAGMPREGTPALAPRWLVYSTRSLFVIVDHPQSGRAPHGQVSFLGISRTGVAQEGQAGGRAGPEG